MALAVCIEALKILIIEELKRNEIEVKEIHCYKIAKNFYIFNIICIDRRLGEFKLHKSAIKHVANNTKGNRPFKYLVHNEIHWSA